MKRVLAIVATLLAFPAAAEEAPVPPPCRMVADAASVRLGDADTALLASLGLDRAGLFARMAETAIPETMGCWAMPVGNFDSQLISVGMAQWNYGTGSLQPVLARFRQGFGSRRRFKAAVRTLAPGYGKLLFSKDCMAVPVRERCRSAILAAHGSDGKLDPTLAGELTALFESDAMLQVQTDAYLDLLREVRAELTRVFPGRPVTSRMLRWAIDTRVQQKGLPPSEDAARLRAKLAAQPPERYWQSLRAILRWYGAIAETADQDGIIRDYAWNVACWSAMIDAGTIDAEQYELLQLTFLKSRTAVGNSGRWQALTFSRRAKIILGAGSVSGRRDGTCPPARAG